jgi:hypothetical protein
MVSVLNILIEKSFPTVYNLEKQVRPPEQGSMLQLQHCQIPATFGRIEKLQTLLAVEDIVAIAFACRYII